MNPTTGYYQIPGDAESVRTNLVKFLTDLQATWDIGFDKSGPENYLSILPKGATAKGSEIGTIDRLTGIVRVIKNPCLEQFVQNYKF